jgi:hypothetical protein
VKKIFLILFIVAVIAGGTFWYEKHEAAEGGAKPAAEKAAADKPDADEAAGTKVSRDDKGNVVITMDDDTQGDNGINVAKVEAVQLAAEVKGYGHVLDPAPLAALLTELASAQAAYAATSNELARLNTMAAQGNASARAVQTGEAAARRDQLAVESAKDRLALAWGKAIAGQTDSVAFLKSLTTLKNVLVRVDLPGGETLAAAPGGVRLVSLAGNSCEGAFLAVAPNVDPQTQGRGFIFLVEANASGLAPGEAVTGFIKITGEPLTGVIVPSAAVVRTEGSGWVYVLQGNAEDFVRVAVPLDRQVDNGWFVTNGVTASNYVVVTGAQMLLSTELKGPAKAAD